jgi:hypothetical protein
LQAFLVLLGPALVIGIGIGSNQEKRAAERKQRMLEAQRAKQETRLEAQRIKQEKWERRKGAVVGMLTPWRRN